MMRKFRGMVAVGLVLLVLGVPALWFAVTHHQAQAASNGLIMNQVISQANPGTYHLGDSTQHSVNLTTVADVPVHLQPLTHPSSSLSAAQIDALKHDLNMPHSPYILPTPSISVHGTISYGLSGPYSGAMYGQVNGNPALAVGTGYAVEMMWPWITVYSVNPTTHHLVSVAHTTKTLNAFFGVASSDQFDEPKAFYDPGRQRYFVAALDDYGSQSSSLFLATSKTSNPTGAWTITKITVPGYNLYGTYMYTLGFGFDSKAIYITVHLFAQNDPAKYVGALLGAMCKVYLISGSTTGCGKLGRQLGYYVGLKEFDGLADHIMPTLTYNSMNAELFVDVDNKTTCLGQSNVYCHYTLWALSDPLNTGLLSGITFVNQPYTPAPHMSDLQGNPIGTSLVYIDAPPVWRDDGLYFSLSSGVNNGTVAMPNVVPAIQWFIFYPTFITSTRCSTCIIIRHATTKANQLMSFAGNVAAFNPSQMVDTVGDVCFTYSIVGGTYNPTSAIDCRSPKSLLTQPATPQVLATGAPYGLFQYSTDTVTAWDPASCTANGCHGMIAVGMYTKPYNPYGTAASVFDYVLVSP